MVQAKHGWLKPAADYGPLVVFFVVNLKFGLMPATAALMGATVIAILAMLVLERRVPMMPLVTACIVGVFGGLSLWLHDETFIKLKPTIVQGMFAVVLLGGLLFGRSLLRILFGEAWQLDDSGWRQLTLRYGLFFAAMAVLNEVVWRTQPTDTWVTFKVFGILGLTVLFSVAQVPLLMRHKPPEQDGS
jgi:intracellular septation protein